MLGFIKKLFGAKPTVETQPEAAPYKVETPTTKVEAVNAQPVADKAVEAVVKSIAKPAASKAPKKPAAKKQQFDKKPAGSKPRKPKAPKQPKA